MIKAVIIREHGGLENLKLETVVDPIARDGCVVIDVKACSVNFADSLMVEGTYQVKPPLPFGPGLEVAGIISKLGKGVSNWSEGDKVIGLTNWGGFAEKVIVPAPQLWALPANMDYEDGAALIIAYGSSHVALDYRAKLKKGEWLLVNGAGGGVGLAAVEVGKLLGAKIIATAGSEENLAIARAKGADFTLNYRHENIRERIKEITKGGGINVAFDPVGGDVLTQSLRAMAPEGRVIVAGFASGDTPKIAANYLLVKNVTLIGYYWGLYKKHKQYVMQNSIAQLFEWYRDGLITPYIGARFSLVDTEDAIRLLRDRKSSGKVVVRI